MSKRLLLTFIAAIVMIVLIAGISALTRKQDPESDESSEITEGTQMIIVPSAMPERISLEVPAGFTETNSPSYDKYYIMNDASIIVTGETLTIFGQDVTSYGESVKQQYQQSADDFALFSEENTVVADVDCRLFEFTYAIKSADAVQEMQCLTAVIIKDDRVYIVTCKSHRDTFANYRQSFRRMIENIEIADESARSAGAVSETLTESAVTDAVS